MSSLTDVQDHFQAALLNGDAALLAFDVENRAADRISIYQEAYRLRLREALASNYPQLKKLLGAEAFDSLADTFMDAYPSKHPSIRWFGRELAVFLEATFPSRRSLAEFAQLEWALSCAFDCADAVPVEVSELAQLHPDQWPTLSFTFHPSVQCLAFHTNAAQMYKAVTLERPIPPFISTERTSWLTWRDELTPRYRCLDADEADALHVLLVGKSFEDMCTALCTHHSLNEVAARAVELLRLWLSARMITDICPTEQVGLLQLDA